MIKRDDSDRARDGNLPPHPRDGLERVSPPAPRSGKDRNARIPTARPNIERLESVVPEVVDFLWPPYIPRNKITLLAGEGGLGKSTLALNLAARVSRGQGMPLANGEDGPLGDPGNVLILNCEDGTADTIVPRLKAAGADLTRIRVVSTVTDTNPTTGEAFERPIRLTDEAVIEAAIKEVRPVLVIVDSVMGFLGKADSDKGHDVRPLLDVCRRLGQRHACTFLPLHHIGKGQKATALEKVLGSVDFVNVSRSVLMLANEPGHELRENRRVLAHRKCNVGPMGPSLSIEVSKDGVRYLCASTHEAEALFAGPQRQPNRLPEAVAWLSAVLRPGPLGQDEVMARAKIAGHAEATIRRAKRILKIESKKQGFGNGWAWSLPPDASESVPPSVL